MSTRRERAPRPDAQQHAATLRRRAARGPRASRGCTPGSARRNGEGTPGRPGADLRRFGGRLLQGLSRAVGGIAACSAAPASRKVRQPSGRHAAIGRSSRAYVRGRPCAEAVASRPVGSGSGTARPGRAAHAGTLCRMRECTLGSCTLGSCSGSPGARWARVLTVTFLTLATVAKRQTGWHASG